jgi:hypothetical protein
VREVQRQTRHLFHLGAEQTAVPHRRRNEFPMVAFIL